MINFKPRFKKCTSYPPGTTYTYLPHPYYVHKESLPLAIFNDHRVAFFYWALWKRDNQVLPDLVTLDWHQDLVYPGEAEKKELEQLDLNDSFEVSFFSWARLSSLNDSHIVSAMYCNIIGNAYVICKQNRYTDYEDEIIKDMFNNKHVIKKFHTTQEAYDYLSDTDVQSVYFDIDLDYFTITNPSVTGWDKPTFIKESAIKSIMDPTSDFMHWAFQRIKGFTIALEPSFVGGLTKAMRLFGVVERTLFTGSIQQKDTTWRHF
nr:MAG TPA: UPF0489 domain protein [Caudoviricetes sp.]